MWNSMEGNYTSWLEQKQNRLQQEEKQETERQKTLQRELEWIRMTQRADTQNRRHALTLMNRFLNNKVKTG